MPSRLSAICNYSCTTLKRNTISGHGHVAGLYRHWHLLAGAHTCLPSVAIVELHVSHLISNLTAKSKIARVGTGIEAPVQACCLIVGMTTPRGTPIDAMATFNLSLARFEQLASTVKSAMPVSEPNGYTLCEWGAEQVCCATWCNCQALQLIVLPK